MIDNMYPYANFSLQDEQEIENVLLEEILSEESLTVIIQILIQKYPEIYEMAEYQMLNENEPDLGIDDYLLEQAEDLGLLEFDEAQEGFLLPEYNQETIRFLAEEIRQGDLEQDSLPMEDLQTLNTRLWQLRIKSKK